MRRRVIARGVAFLGVLGGVQFVSATPLDPLAFTSVGTLALTVGSITINPDTLASTRPTNFTGVTFDQGSFVQNSVTDFDRTVVVFDFNDISIAGGVTVTVTGSRPLALLSRGNLTLGPAINMN